MNELLAPLMSSAQQDWRTPRDLFDQISEIAGAFDVDIAATSDNALCRHYYGPDHVFSDRRDALAVDWSCDGRYARAWLNPPYGRSLGPFAAKAVREASRYAFEVWMLVPARVDTRWWNALMTKAVTVRFMAGRVKFEREDGARDSAPFPTAVIQLRHDGGNPEVFWGWRP